MQVENLVIEKDLVIVGGGMPGICAAIQAARLGLSVALVQARGFLGGNASPEIRVTIEGADGSGEFNFYSRESGVMEELRLENRYRNPQGNAYLWHDVMLDAVFAQPNIALYLNTYIDTVENNADGSIAKVYGTQTSSETRLCFAAPYFMDDTGDGTLGHLAGASYKVGREGKAEYNESIAPDEADNLTMLSTLSFYSKDTKRDAPFQLPDYAQNETVASALQYRTITDRKPGNSRWEGYRMNWYYETGSGKDQVRDTEEIMQDHRVLVNGIWNQIKNSGNYPDSKLFDFEYISGVPGKRESRRLEGEYFMTQHDIQDQPHYEDCIGHGGWSVDLHAMEGFFSTDLVNRHYILKGVYEIPYRASYTRKVPNLWTIGRSLSVSHVALGTLRVMATLACVGQAAACAAALCKQYGTDAHGVYTSHLAQLQQLILAGDQYVPQAKRTAMESPLLPTDLALGARVTASSTQSCACTEGKGAYRLEKETALTLPVCKPIDAVQLRVRATEATTLRYCVMCPDAPHHYNPAQQLAQGEVAVPAGADFAWCTLPIGQAVPVPMGKIMVILEENPLCTLAVAQDAMNGVFFLSHEASPLDTYFDLKTNAPKEANWRRVDGVPCFMMLPEQPVYAAENLVNGYIRNDALPCLWLSAKEDSAPAVQVHLPQRTTVGKVKLTFDSSLDKVYHHLELYAENRVFPTVVDTCKIYAKVNGKLCEIATMAHNHQRVQTFMFAPVETDCIEVHFGATHGAPRVGVYDLQVCEG